MKTTQRRRGHRGATRIVLHTLPILLSAPAFAETAIPLPPVQVDSALDGTTATTLSGDTLDEQRSSSDTAAMLKGLTGVNLTAGGGQSSLPTMHGLADDRIKTLVDGMPITASCPNHMNPVLGYIQPSAVAKVEAIAGITPVSRGGDSIGGTIAVQSSSPVFAKPGEDVHVEGSASVRYRSNNQDFGQALTGTVATDRFSARYHADHAKANSYHDGNGDRVMASEYEQESHDLTLAAKAGDGVVTLKGGQKFTPSEGFPNQYMDLLYNRSHYLNGRYQGAFGWGDLDVRAYWQNVKHYMNFLEERTNYAGGVGMPMYTKGDDVGYSVDATVPAGKTDTVRIGNSLHRYTLNDWWPPVSNVAGGMMSPDTFWNVNDGERTVLGTYAEWETRPTEQWTHLLGVRNDMVWTDADRVQGYSTAMYGTDANAFNAEDRSKLDANWDLTALTRFERDRNNTLEAGYARKTRSPNLYERYAWSTGSMAMRMVNWFGDGNGYVGDVSLRPEVAHTLSASSDWHDGARQDWNVKVTPYYTYIHDYIGVDKIGTATFTTNGNSIPLNLLRFANHDAMIYGFDVSGGMNLWNDAEYGSGRLKGTLGWMDGHQVNTGDTLYRMLPINAHASIEHTLGSWTNELAFDLMGQKSGTDTLRKEHGTKAYALVNLYSGYQWQNVSFRFGIENLLNKQYYSPLGGVDVAGARAKGNQSAFENLAGEGRSVTAEMTVTF